MGLSIPANPMVFEMADSASVTLATRNCLPHQYVPFRTSEAKAPVMICHSISKTVSELRNGSVLVRVVNVVQCRQYFFLSALVLATTPSVVASHADKQARANIGREEGDILPMICSMAEGNSS